MDLFGSGEHTATRAIAEVLADFFIAIDVMEPSCQAPLDGAATRRQEGRREAARMLRKRMALAKDLNLEAEVDWAIDRKRPNVRRSDVENELSTETYTRADIATSAEEQAASGRLDARWERRLADVERVMGEAHAGALELAVALGDTEKAKELMDEYLAKCHPAGGAP